MASEEDAKRSKLPYAAEYAKSSRSSCKVCREQISSGALRMSIRLPSRFFDGLQDNWFHFGCFWKRIKKNDINEGSIRGMDRLKWDDQEKIREKIQSNQVEGGADGGSSSASMGPPKVEYAKTKRGKCAACKQTIDKDTLKIGVKSSWFHRDCFKTAKPDFAADAESFVGFVDLDEEDKDAMKEMFKKPEPKKEEVKKEEEESDEPASKKQKIDEAEALKKKLKAQADEQWKLREQFEKCLSKKGMQMLLEENGQEVPAKYAGESALLDLLVDCAMFGCPEKCEQCGGQIRFSSSNQKYLCSGHATAFTRCLYSDRNPPRFPFSISKEMKADNPELAAINIKKPRERVYNTAAEGDVVVQPKSFNYLGASSSRYLGDYGTGMKSGHSGDYQFGKQRRVMKDGAFVDPECEYAEVVHVWRDKKGKLYQATMGSVDVTTDKNSYYKIQLLEHDAKKTYYVFRSWGRVGSLVGGQKTESFGSDLEAAKRNFETLFFERTQNEWKDRENFVKRPGAMCILETDVSDQTERPSLKKFNKKPGSASKLPKSVQEVVAKILDVKAMTHTLQEFEIDMAKMPLGKLSKKQLKTAHGVLTELQNLMANGEVKYEQFLDATNRFYTYVPHDFGNKAPPLLNNTNIIAEKAKMLDELMEIEIAYSILKSDDASDAERDPIDVHYEKLHVQLETMDKKGEEYERLVQYVKNTHGATHNDFTLQVIDILRVRRDGESERFRKDIHNRQLLWHGSRMTNYAGILSQGLRIAPPEAPSTGYMFGKGVYFADMVSKSANYCHAYNDEGFLLLCDVALGEMQEEKQANCITKLNPGKHSCKGLGTTIPDPKGAFVTEDGVTIPMGKPKTTKARDLSLLYNEYIVYDVAQIEMKYLIRAKFISTF